MVRTNRLLALSKKSRYKLHIRLQYTFHFHLLKTASPFTFLIPLTFNLSTSLYLQLLSGISDPQKCKNTKCHTSINTLVVVPTSSIRRTALSILLWWCLSFHPIFTYPYDLFYLKELLVSKLFYQKGIEECFSRGSEWPTAYEPSTKPLSPKKALLVNRTEPHTHTSRFLSAIRKNRHMLCDPILQP